MFCDAKYVKWVNIVKTCGSVLALGLLNLDLNKVKKWLRIVHEAFRLFLAAPSTRSLACSSNF